MPFIAVLIAGFIAMLIQIDLTLLGPMVVVPALLTRPRTPWSSCG